MLQTVLRVIVCRVFKSWSYSWSPDSSPALSFVNQLLTALR